MRVRQTRGNVRAGADDSASWPECIEGVGVRATVQAVVESGPSLARAERHRGLSSARVAAAIGPPWTRATPVPRVKRSLRVVAYSCGGIFRSMAMDDKEQQTAFMSALVTEHFVLQTAASATVN